MKCVLINNARDALKYETRNKCVLTIDISHAREDLDTNNVVKCVPIVDISHAREAVECETRYEMHAKQR